ncbi:hypothetical protein EYV94_25215 [Puteibacter caeruleilacunae]|nr:hypothetical protein EYV94_25215 [Puteibacter caeruleilacunae]
MRKRVILLLVFVAIAILNVEAQQKDDKAVFYHSEKGVGKEFVKANDYVAPLSMDFDTQNRPYLLNNTLIDQNETDGIYQIATIRDNKWVHYSYKDELEEMFGENLYMNPDDNGFQGLNASRSAKMMIDDDNNLYAVVGVAIKNEKGFKVRYVLVFAHDIASVKFNGVFQILDVFPANATAVSMEVRNSFNGSKDFAPLINYTIAEKDWPYKTGYSWASHGRYTVHLLNGYIKGRKLVFKEDVVLDNHVGGFSQHSGGETFAVTKGHYSYVCYMRHDVDPAKDKNGNNAVYVNCFDRKKNKLTNERVFLFESTPVFADVHSTPVIGIDKDGYLYIQGGAHANNPTGEFKDTRSKRPLDITEWEEIKEIGFNRTYTCLLIDNNNQKHTFFRSSNPYKLYYQTGDCINGYTNDNGKLFVDQNSDAHYRVYYHHLHKDRKQRIYVSWTPNSGADYETWDFRRVLAYSEDSGLTWKIATLAKFIEEMD